MPSFARDEENAPVLTQTPLHPASPFAAFNSTISSSGKNITGRLVSRPLAGSAAAGPLAFVDSNVNGRRLQYTLSSPSSPPPSPPLADGRYYPRPSRSFHSAQSDMSSDSSTDMNGHGGGSSSGRAASSHGTTVPTDDENRFDSCGTADERDDSDPAKPPIRPTMTSSSSSSSPTAPSRAPPPPPILPQSGSGPATPGSAPAQSPSPNAASLSSSQSRQPLAAPSHPPPLPPNTDILPRKRNPLANGGPISVPNPILVDRTRVVSSPQLPTYAGESGASGEINTPRDDGRLWNSATSATIPTSGQPSPIETYSRKSESAIAQQSSSLSPLAIGSGTAVNGISTSVTASSPSASPSLGPGTYTSPSTPGTGTGAPDSVPRNQFLGPQQQTPQQQSQLLGKPTTASPHRFSSPPIYNPASSPVPGPSGLKHRHTLEVPRPSPARNSRDSDGAFASGRFSPTASGAGSIGGRRASLNLVRRNTRSLHSDYPVPDEDALRWTEAYRQKRASKRRRMELDDDQVLVGTKVDETHTNWVAAYNMLTGIRVSVSRTNAKLDRPLTDEDFQTKQKSTFDIAGNELVPSAKYDFKFKDYAPWVFRHLRALFHLDPADYLMSLAGKYILSELGSPGKSGSFFYFSRDYKYIIKTIHHSEHKFLRRILKDYYKHVTENPNTLLSQFFGLHRVKMPYGRKIHFVVMNNLFPPHRDIHRTFDLKGSTIGRDFPEERIAQNPRATMKDLNWLRRHEHLEFGLVKKRLFLEQLQKDVKLLQRLHIMDYSLLVGVHDLNKGNEENLRGKTLQVFEPGGDNQEGADPQQFLMRTPSRLEHMRKTRELRQMLKSERPIPIDQSSNRMPDELEDNRKCIFYKDDGGFQATHQNNAPGDEVYYLGVIDCLTHYGIIKKIEHFWKGLSSDRNQISALPPEQYGDRFFKFVSGIAMSPEDAAIEARVRDEAEAAELAAANNAATAATAEESLEKAPSPSAAVSGCEPVQMAEPGGSWSTSGMRHRGAGGGSSQAGPSSVYASRASVSSQAASLPRNSDSGDVAAHRAAEHEAEKASPLAESELTNVLHTTVSSSSGTVIPSLHVAPGSPSANTHDRRESMLPPVLPIVDEAGEGSSTGGQSHSSRASSRTVESEYRPVTPAKDGVNEYRPRTPAKDGAPHGGLDAPTMQYDGIQAPKTPTPPNTGYLKPESADSGYGVSGTRSRSGTVGSGRKVRPQLSRESLDKALPPLPQMDRAA